MTDPGAPSVQRSKRLGTRPAFVGQILVLAKGMAFFLHQKIDSYILICIKDCWR